MNKQQVADAGMLKLLCSAIVITIAILIGFINVTFVNLLGIGSIVIVDILCAISIVLTVFLYRVITSETGQRNTDLTSLAKGDLKIGHKYDVGKSTYPTDAITAIRGKVYQIIVRIIAEKTTLDSTYDELTIIANDTLSGSEKLSMESKSLATSSEQLSGNVTSMATAAEELSTTSRTVASAVEELSSSITEVARNSENGARIGRDVNVMAKEAEQIMSKMEQGTKQITSIVAAIQGIADQINLLALNATIEAASAGEAGKGFAIVAGEVKDLARLSMNKSKEISQQVEQVQQNTQKAITTIKQLFGAIEELSSATNTIAAAVEEQSSTTTEIAHSITNVSTATDELARNIQETSSASSDVAKRTSVLEELARQTALVSSQIAVGSESVNDVRSELENIIQVYQTDDKIFDISEVKMAHMNWVKQLQSVLRGELVLKPEEVSTHTVCDFGKWFFSDDGKKLSTIPAYAEVDKYHEQVHAYAREVVRLYGNKQYEEAQRKMGEFETARNNLFCNLNHLYCS